MVLINDLTIGDINSALIHLQRARGEVVGGEKGDTIQNISITNKGTSSRDWSNEIERLAKKVSDNEEEIERVRVELMELFNSLVDNHIISVEYIQEDRTLIIETNADTFEVEIPEDNVKLYINDNVLYFQTPSQTKSVELPYIPLSEKGVPNGVATLDSSGRLPYSQLPESAMEFLGEWDASTNTPTLKDGIGVNGNFYIVTVGGTVNFGTQATPRLVTFYPNDRVVYEGDNERWFRLPAGSVVSVNGLSGVVELNGTNVNYDNTSGSPTLKSKIDDIETMAETQADWNESNSSAVSFIKNKPTIPQAQVQSDWTQTDSTQKDFIKNKIPVWIVPGASGSDMTPVDNITDGQMRPPTSNAVYDILNPLAVNKGGTGQTSLANVDVGSAGKWTTARDIKIQDADGTNTGSAVSVDGSENETLKLPSTIKATLSGNASTATKVEGTYTGSGGQQNPRYVGKNRVCFNMMNTSINGNTQYKDFMMMDCYNGFDVGGTVALGINRQSLGAYIMRANAGTRPDRPTTWADSAELIHTKNLLNILYPVGAIYLTISSSDFSNFLGGTWKKVTDGRFIRASGTNAENVPTVAQITAGSGGTQAEGLPNITGYIQGTDYSIGSNTGVTNSGAMKGEEFNKKTSSGTSQSASYMSKISFNASNGNSTVPQGASSGTIYGNSNHVTPYNMAVYMWVRTA